MVVTLDAFQGRFDSFRSIMKTWRKFALVLTLAFALSAPIPAVAKGGAQSERCQSLLSLKSGPYYGGGSTRRAMAALTSIIIHAVAPGRYVLKPSIK